MSKRVPRGRRDTGSVNDRLARLLDTPLLARIVPHLAPETLHRLIRYRGLDACGELVTSATPEQLTSVLDLDLWPNTEPGRDQRFDEDRFGEWLELLEETGHSARTVAAIDQNLVITGLSRYIRVCDSATVVAFTSDDDVPMDVEATPGNGPECEVGGYVVRARRTDAWDAILALLVALDADHRDYFHGVMQGCRRLSNSTPEVDGLDDLLMEPAQQRHDVALERERRRSQQGYSTPADAQAFLQMARQPRRQRPSTEPSINPLAAAYFRAADDAVVDLLTEAGLVPERPRALLEGAAPQPSRLSRIRPLMAHLRATDHSAYLGRSRELAFLANTLMAGCTVRSRSFTAQEASDAAAATCNLGLEHWPSLPDSFLADHDLVTAFEVGWAVLHEDVSMFVAVRLIETLTDLQCADAEVHSDLGALRLELVRQRDAGTPWRARHALDVLAMLDMPAWVGVRGLLDECPVVPAAVTAILEGHTRSVSATAFEFIATTGQIRDVRAFMGELPDVLLGHS